MSQLLGKRIGHFRVIDLIGKGGMGEVYVGYDETLERRVALKSIRADHRLDANAKARFLREARVLSQLAHPNICQIFDYIEGEDANVLVLELIRGRNLASAMKKGLDQRHNLQVAEQIARVLMAAHEKNIVHRDLKPDNVMLTEEGQVKVLDFGLSRALVDEGTLVLEGAAAAEKPPGARSIADTEEILPHAGEDTMRLSPAPSSPASVTSHGAIMGTLGYMSPEQAGGEVATTASDMYSLGLILQEMFTGKRPYASGLSPHELLRKSQAGETLPVNGIDPDIAALINRLKSLAPAARPSAVDTVERIQWIRDKPHRKRKTILVASAIVTLALFCVLMTLMTIRATRAEKAAEREAEVARNVTEFLVDLFAVSDPYEQKSGETVTARELLDKGAGKVAKELKNEPEVQSRMMATIGRVYRKLGLFAQAQPPLETALAVREKLYGPDHADVADSLFNLASLYSDQGKYAEAEPLFKRSLAIREKSLGPDDPLVADVLNNLAALYANQGKFEVAQPLLERSLAIREKALGPDSPLVADGLNNLAALNSVQGRVPEAEALYKKSLAIRENVYGPNHPRVADSLNNLSVDYFENGRLAEAEPLAERALAIYEKALGPNHPHLADSLNNLAEIRQLQGKYEEAAPLYERSLAICEKAYGPDHQEVAYELNFLGKVVLDEGKLPQAEPLLRRSLAIYEKSVGLDHPDAAHTLFNLACLEAKSGRKSEAISFLQRALPGSADTSWIRTIEKEPALSSLRGNAEFDAIVAKVKKSAGS